MCPVVNHAVVGPECAQQRECGWGPIDREIVIRTDHDALVAGELATACILGRYDVVLGEAWVPGGARERGNAGGLERIPVGIAHTGATAPRERQRRCRWNVLLAGQGVPRLQICLPLGGTCIPAIKVTERMALNIMIGSTKWLEQITEVPIRRLAIGCVGILDKPGLGSPRVRLPAICFGGPGECRIIHEAPSGRIARQEVVAVDIVGRPIPVWRIECE